MRNFLTIALLTMSVFVFAQKQQFTEYYNTTELYTNGVSTKQVKTNSRVTYNYKNDAYIVVESLGNTIVLAITSETTYFTHKGYTWQIVKAISSQGEHVEIMYSNKLGIVVNSGNQSISLRNQ